MALLWCDGFDHYAAARDLEAGAYAESGVSLVTTARTGAKAAQTSSSTSFMRRVLGGAKSTVGIAAGLQPLALPTANNAHRIFAFRDAGNLDQVTIVLQTTGVIEARRGGTSGVLLAASASPALTALTYQHVEAMVHFSNTVGWVELRVNGVTVLSVTGVDTVNTASEECSQVVIGGGSAGTAVCAVDDVFCYDDTGSFNNTFLGDRRVLTLFPDANTAQADWTAVGAASGYEAIDEASPDGDTSYITAGPPGSPGPISEFGIQNLPAGVSAVSAVVLVEFARKTEAGPANTQWSVVSGASETAGVDKPLTEIYTYRQDVFEADPDTAAPFTPGAVDALLIKVERTQ